MIWATAVDFLRSNWRGLAVLAAVAVALWSIHAWMERECAQRETALRQEYDQLLRAAEKKNRDIETTWRNLVYEADRDHQTRLQALEAKYSGAVDLIGPVRLCPRSPVYPATVSRDPPRPAGNHGAAGGDGLSGRAEQSRDIGPALVRIAQAADTQTARLIACQNYIRALETPR